MMRIVLLAHAPVLGGSTELLIQARDYFLSHGHVVQCVFGTNANPADPRTADAWIIPPVPGGWRNQMREYVRQIESFHPDIVYTFAGKDEIDVLRFLRCVRVRHTSTLEEHPFFSTPYTLKKNRGFIEACTANTPDALEQSMRLSGQAGFLLPYLFPEPLNPITEVDPSRLMDERNPIEIAFVSRIECLQKRAQWLPEIIQHCEKAATRLNWHFYGDGPYASVLRSRLQNRPLVTFHGWVDRKTLYEKLPDHDILFFCSRWEGLPIAMVEGMRCGLACVSTDIPAGIRWTLEQGGGWLYDANTPVQAAEALIKATRDRTVLLQKRREALQLAKKLFSPKVTEAEYVQLETSFAQLRYNGNSLDLNTAPRLHGVSVLTFLKRQIFKPER